jgi:L-alanine-DL-glutamate epimerase-like enolase superfamily enzyme
MKTITIQAAECRLPLPRPIILGPVSIRTRDFVALRITTDNGLVGDALGYTRGTPLLQTLRHVGHHFLGVSPHHRKGAVEAFVKASINGRGAFVRAVSLLDIALHDLAAKAVELPLFRLLGGARTRIPASGVAGYYLNERAPDDVRDEVSEMLDSGYPRVKIMIGGADAAADASLVALISKVARGRLGVDAHWSWDTLADALRTCIRLDDEGLAFLEDPFAPHRSRLMPQLQERLRTPLACGEDMPDVDSLAALSREIPILRVDATTCGGISAACAAIQVAGLNGCEVFPHIHHQLHAHLAAVYSEATFVEVIPEYTGADPAHLLLKRIPPVIDGMVHLDETPGAGTELNWDAVEKYATESFTLALNDQP